MHDDLSQLADMFTFMREVSKRGKPTSDELHQIERSLHHATGLINKLRLDIFTEMKRKYDESR